LSVPDQRLLIQRDHESLSVKRQCQLLGLARSSCYFIPRETPAEDLSLMRAIDQHYTAHPSHGSRRIGIYLRRAGRPTSRSRIVRLMRQMGLQGQSPGVRTTLPTPGHERHPNLLAGQAVTAPGQVWCTDITYLPMLAGTMYLVVVMDWYSRCILSWQLSNSLDGVFCREALQTALDTQPAPTVFHSDQGCQFTAQAFTELLKHHHIAISMSGRGRAYDNIFVERFWRSLKYEEIYLHEYHSVGELRRAVSAWITHYNTDRPHQALDYQVPWEVHTTGLAKRPKSGQGRHQGGLAPAAVSAPPTSFMTHSRSGRPALAPTPPTPSSLTPNLST
jgi:putative transposase